VPGGAEQSIVLILLTSNEQYQLTVSHEYQLTPNFTWNSVWDCKWIRRARESLIAISLDLDEINPRTDALGPSFSPAEMIILDLFSPPGSTWEPAISWALNPW